MSSQIVPSFLVAKNTKVLRVLPQGSKNTRLVKYRFPWLRAIVNAEGYIKSDADAVLTL